MGSVKIDRFEQNLTTLEVKKKAWAMIRKMHARALLEAHDTVLRAYYEALYASHTQVTQHGHHVTSSMYRRNNSEAQVKGKTTPRVAAKATRMRVNEGRAAQVSQEEARSAGKYEPWGEEPLGKRRR